VSESITSLVLARLFWRLPAPRTASSSMLSNPTNTARQPAFAIARRRADHRAPRGSPAPPSARRATPSPEQLARVATVNHHVSSANSTSVAAAGAGARAPHLRDHLRHRTEPELASVVDRHEQNRTGTAAARRLDGLERDVLGRAKQIATWAAGVRVGQPRAGNGFERPAGAKVVQDSLPQPSASPTDSVGVSARLVGQRGRWMPPSTTGTRCSIRIRDLLAARAVFELMVMAARSTAGTPRSRSIRRDQLVV